MIGFFKPVHIIAWLYNTNYFMNRKIHILEGIASIQNYCIECLCIAAIAVLIRNKYTCTTRL